MKAILTGLFLCLAAILHAQKTPWNGKRAAVVLTYDDAINEHLDKVIPALDSISFKGTFYIIGSSSVTNARMTEWRAAAQRGHELGNHGLVHPCDGSKPGRGFVTADNDLSKYTVSRAVKEIRLNNTLLKAIDGKTIRTYAYPCADRTIGGKYFYDELKDEFAGARGVTDTMHRMDSVQLDNIDCYNIADKPAEYMIDLVKKATKNNSLLVFLFHGVGGGHSLNEDLGEHSKLLRYLKAHESELWIAPMVDVAQYVKRK
jgi:peptidoglycan-N-acetylglucosamine deacetylase